MIMPTDDPGIDAAAKVIYEAGRFHHWWGVDKPYDKLDPIGKDEFDGIIRHALDAADAARKNARSGISKVPISQDLHALRDAVTIIRKSPRMYLGGVAEATGQHLAARLMTDLVWLGALPAEVRKIESWWVVASKQDWLVGEGRANVDIAFSKIVPFPEAGVNSFRSEILLSAFADAVITVDASGTRWIKGTERGLTLPATIGLICPEGERMVAFRLGGS
jgi:hypothetical protein